MVYDVNKSLVFTHESSLNSFQMNNIEVNIFVTEIGMSLFYIHSILYRY
jgi:hypothetical protein